MLKGMIASWINLSFFVYSSDLDKVSKFKTAKEANPRKFKHTVDIAQDIRFIVKKIDKKNYISLSQMDVDAEMDA